jgi:hypothetical protein
MDMRWRRSDSETTDIWLPAKGNWLFGSMGGMTAADELDALRLGRHLNLAGEQDGGSIARAQGKLGCRKARIRARKAEAHNDAVHMGFFPGQIPFPKSVQSSPSGYS